MQETLEKVKETIVEETTSILDYKFIFSDQISITVKGLIFIVVALVITSFILKLIRRFTTRKMSLNDKQKFVTVFGYIRWFVFLIIFLIAMHTSGVNVTAVFAASAALLIGVGLALQTLFQDIISGIFILVDQSVHAGDIIELEGKIGRVLDIRLRTTRAVTIDNRVLVIPNHLYLTNILFNWTENGTETREYVDVADSSLNFRLAFSLNDSFEARFIKSDLRFAIDKAFREHNVTIPFPQRDVHVFTNAKPGIQFEKIEHTAK